MLFKRRLLFFRLAAALIIFLLCWVVLVLSSPIWDKAAILSELDDKLELKFLNPNIRGAINSHGWHVLAALLVAAIFFTTTKKWCTKQLSRRLDKSDPLIAGWWISNPPVDVPSEYMLDTLAMHYSPIVFIQNVGYSTMKIKRIEVTLLPTRKVQLNDGQQVEKTINGLEATAPSTAKDLVRWTSMGPNTWYMDGVPHLDEKYHILLPTIDITFDTANEDIKERIGLLAGDPTLQAKLSLLFYFEGRTVGRELTAPLRILPVKEEWEDDDPPKELIEKLSLPSDELREKFHTAYHTIWKLFQQQRAEIVIATQQADEKERLIELRHELEPYDRYLEVTPDDPAVHLELGQFLLERGFVYESLASFQRAEALGMNTHELHVLIATPLLELGRTDEVLAALGKVINPQAAGANFFAMRGRALHDKKRYEDARSDLYRAIDLDPQSYLSYVFLCMTIRDLEPFDPKEFVNLVKRAVDKGYRDRNIIDTLSKMVGDPEHSAILQLAVNFPAPD